MTSISKNGKQPDISNMVFGMKTTTRGIVRFQDWDDMDQFHKLTWIKKFIYEITDPIELRSKEERDRKSPFFKKDYREVKLSRWKKSLMEGTLGDRLAPIEYFYDCELMKFQLSDRQKTEIQRNAELACLKRENEQLKEKNQRYETIEEDYENLQWDNMSLKQDKEKLEKTLKQVSDARDRACEYIAQLKTKIPRFSKK